MSECDPLTEDERQEIERHLQRDPDADRALLKDAIRRRRGRDHPEAERIREDQRAALGEPEAIKAKLQRLRDNPPPAPTRPDDDRPEPEPPPVTSPAELEQAATVLAHVASRQRAAPLTVEPETRADRRILPALQVVGPAPERERGILFGGLVDDRPRTADLTLFPAMEPERHRVPILEIVDAAGAPLRSRGRGAPIEARLLVRGGLLMIRPEDRGHPIVRIAVTVGELLDGLYPTAGRARGEWRRIAENWPKTEAALRRVHNYTVTSTTGGRWFPMTLRELPALGLPAADDLVVLDLAPPPGAKTGPSIDLPALDDMGVTSGPRWRAYIAGRSLLWLPGKTRRPVPRTRSRFGWSADPEDYPVLTLADLRRLAFGDSDAKNRTRASIVAAWEDLPDVLAVPHQIDPRTGIRGYRLLPIEAEQAIQRLRDRAVFQRRNRGV